ncbi:MAG: hypothetical protein ACYC6A_04625 [Armatimonadota bacterium]
MRCFIILSCLLCLAGLAFAEGQVWVRVTLLEPEQTAWRAHMTAYTTRSKVEDLYIGETAGTDAKAVQPHAAGTPSEWVDFTPYLKNLKVVSVRFVFENLKNVRARFDIATAPSDEAIVRSITDYDREWQGKPGNIISLRIPQDPVKDKQWLLSIREDAVRRLDEIKALKLPEGPRPQQIICMTGFRSNGQFYTDPAIAEMDFDIITMLGMNGWWEQNGGQPGELRKFAMDRGINVSTVYPRQVANPPADKEAGGVRLDWPKLTEWFDKTYAGPFAQRKESPYPAPRVIADLMDEPGGIGFGGPEYQAEFRTYLQQKGFTPAFFGKASWEEVESPRFGWWQYFKLRDPLFEAPLEARRLHYWATRFWNDTTAKLYGMATERVMKNDPNVLGTRVNFGPYWWYDYGSLPRGIDAFRFGEIGAVTLGFNEDWIGNGNVRWPLEVVTYLRDVERGAMRPQGEVTHGCYVTCDSNRRTVKLRAFGLLARETKIFDFYYYGPSYTYFDHWSDNFSMVQGVAELTRDMAAVDGLLYAGKAPKAEVALLYSRSWPAWKRDDSEQNELIQAYLALLHAGIPVDIVGDEEVADGRFARRSYKALYVVNESIPTTTLTAIEAWVKKGGRLWVTGWAGMRDEYNEPTAAWNDLLAVKERSWKPTGDLANYGKEIQPADWKRPIFGREVTGIEESIRRYGNGLVWTIAWAPGKAYMDGAKQVKGTLADAILYPDGIERDVYAKFALDAGVKPPAVTSVSQILAYPLWSKSGGVVLIANYTGEPAKENVTVRFQAPVDVTTLRSLRHGALKFTRKGGYIECSVPVDDVTDILVVNQ